jgi:uncharacterized membrane protein YphA (DoxX/SURF4 family)
VGVRATIAAWDEAVRRDELATRVAWVAGAIFWAAGLTKLLAWGWQLHNFRRFGLPAPELFVILAGVIELYGGAAFVLRRHTVPAALLLIPTMTVAIVLSGIRKGDVVPSLTLAPLLLLSALIVLVRALGGVETQAPEAEREVRASRRRRTAV